MYTLKYVGQESTRIRFEDGIKKEVKKGDVVEIKNFETAIWFQRNGFIQIKEIKKEVETKKEEKKTTTKKPLKTKKSK